MNKQPVIDQWEEMLVKMRRDWLNALPYEKKNIEERAFKIKRNIEIVKEWRILNPRFVPKQEEKEKTTAELAEEIFR